MINHSVTYTRETNQLAQILQIHKASDTKNHAPQGENLTTSFLDKVERQADIDLSEEEVKTTKSLLGKNNQYKDHRHNRWLQKVMTARQKNRTVQKKGVDYTPGLRRLIPYGRLRNNTYIPKLRIELDAREVEYDDTNGVIKLIALLRKDEDVRHKLDNASFRNLTDFQWYL